MSITGGVLNSVGAEEKDQSGDSHELTVQCQFRDANLSPVLREKENENRICC